jgi:hypothetical protein
MTESIQAFSSLRRTLNLWPYDSGASYVHSRSQDRRDPSHFPDNRRGLSQRFASQGSFRGGYISLDFIAELPAPSIYRGEFDKHVGSRMPAASTNGSSVAPAPATKVNAESTVRSRLCRPSARSITSRNKFRSPFPCKNATDMLKSRNGFYDKFMAEP